MLVVFFSLIGKILTFLLPLFLIVFAWFQYRYKYWQKFGIYTLPTGFPYGNIKELFYNQLHIGQQFEKLYYDSKTRPYVGIFLGHKPALLINDPELIKTILVKDFIHFTDHGFVHHEESEPLEGHLFNINGNRWKNLRVKLITSFSSGKMKIMFDTMLRYAVDVQNFLKPQVEAGKHVDLKELLSRYTTDIIGSTVFGIECKSIGDDKNMFRMMSRKSQRLNFFRSMVQMMSLIAPWFVRWLKTSMYQSDVNEFFMKEAIQAYMYRKRENIQGNDYMQTLTKLRDDRDVYVGQGKQIDAETEDDDSMSAGDLAAQFFVFFVDGAETSSTAASFALYELARNPDIQEKVRKEIDEVLERYDGKLSYEAITDMKYLFQVIEESLRMYPPLPLLVRLCTRNYQLPNTNITIEKGTLLMIPMLGIHRDPETYPNPMQFDPERFSSENKAERHRFMHLPFGEGPRMCMGNRFGALMARMGLISILSQFVISIDEKEIRSFTYEQNQFILSPVGGIKLNLKKREKPTIFKI